MASKRFGLCTHPHSWRQARLRVSLLLWAFLGLCLTIGGFSVSVDAQSTAVSVVRAVEARSLVQQGQERYEAEQFAAAIATWKQAAQMYQNQGDTLSQATVLSNLSLAYQQWGDWTQASETIAESLKLVQSQPKPAPTVLAQALNTQASLQLALGQPEQALATWQRAIVAYAQAGDTAGKLRGLINQAQALKALGLYRRALDNLTEANQLLQQQPDSLLKATGLQSLGTALGVIGDLDQSRQTLQQSLTLAEQLQSSAAIGSALVSLGNTARAQQDIPAALAFYQRAAQSPSLTMQIQAQLNQLSFLLDQQQLTAAEVLVPQIQANLAKLPPSHTAAYARINFVQSLTQLKQQAATAAPTWSAIAQLAAMTVEQAQSLGDRRAQAYALGSLGAVYEQTQQWAIAQNLTEQALQLAQMINAPDIAYRWQWQLGRLLKRQTDLPGAIAAYTESVKTLQSLRSDLVATNPNVQFSFREQVEPVYRELVSLLLQPSKETNQANLVQARMVIESSQANLVQARTVIESLQLAELDNFFREACLNARPAQIDRVDPQAAVLYPIILPDRLEVILSLPQQPLRHYATTVSGRDVDSTVEILRQSLLIRSKRDYQQPSRTLYDWLIRPIESALAASKIKTLVFVLDGSLRNVPMAALSDGQQYLIEKYSLALTPGLQLLDPKPLQRKTIKVLTAGLAAARQGFAPLENVALELEEIKAEVPTVELLDQAFTSANFRKEMAASPFPIVHIATHGQFSSKAEDTFLLTWDGRININQFTDLLQAVEGGDRPPIELLVLSACQTAIGDKRAALGLAGLAVRAGARSTLATLWSINDAATANVMSQFYQALLSPTTTKAEALQRAQRALLEDPQYAHPIYWAAYVLVGNWL